MIAVGGVIPILLELILLFSNLFDLSLDEAKKVFLKKLRLTLNKGI